MANTSNEHTSFEECTSFLRPRDPSIERWKRPIYMNPRNLIDSAFDACENNAYQVFLRLKPSEETSKTYTVVDNQTLQAEVPKECETYKGATVVKRRFTFSSILNKDASQCDTFRTCVLPSLESFINGANCVVMSYGTTSAGKTYTMQGNREDPGVIPRALHHIFETFSGKLEPECLYRPQKNVQLLEMDDNTYRQEMLHKYVILTTDFTKSQRKVDSSCLSFETFLSRNKSYDSEIYRQMEANMKFEGSNLSDQDQENVSVWLSMIEIYNDTILDLLALPNEKLNKLSLGEDGCGGFYVKNAKQIQVENGHEAFQVNQFGRRSLHRSSTALNDRSSRSHCIFTITLVKRAASTTLSRISFVDLAGSERAKKTKNEGVRLVESNSINKSLAALGKCLHAMKTKQNVVPVRDSKLTTLFRSALMGSERLTFIINVSTDRIIFDETMHVLKFSALAQEIVPEQNVRPATRFSRIVHSGLFRQPSFAWSRSTSRSDLSESLEKQIELLKQQMAEAEERSKAANDLAEHLNERNECLQAMLQKKKGEFNDMREKFSVHFKNVFETNEEDRRQIASERDRLLEEKAQADRQVGALKSKLIDLRKENKYLKKHAQNLDGEEGKENCEFEYGRILKKNKDLEALLNEASADYEALTEESKNLTVENFKLKEENDELLVTLLAIKEEKEAMQLEMENLITRSSEREKEYLAQLDEINDLREKNLQNRQLLEEAKLSSEKLSVEIEAIKDENEGYKQEIEDYKNGYKESETLLVAKENEIDKIREANSKLEADIQQRQLREADLEDEVSSLSKSVKLLSSKELEFRKEKDALEAVIAILEKQLTESTSVNQSSEINELKAKVIEQENVAKMLQTKLEAAEYQVKVYCALKEKADEELSTVSELRQTIELLESELINKDQELLSFQNQRELIFNQQEREIKKYKEEVERLKKDVSFGHLVVERLTDSAKKDDVAKLRIEVNAKVASLEKQVVVRHHVNSLDVPSFNSSHPSKSTTCLPSLNTDIRGDAPEPDRNKMFYSLENICSEENSKNMSMSTRNKNRRRSTSVDENQRPTDLKKSTRKARSVRKWDPTEHPALNSPRRRQNRRNVKISSPESETEPLRSRKQLFSADDFIELDAPTSLRATRSLRPRKQ